MASRVWVPVASGPLAWCAAGYGSWLAARGYSRWTVAHRLWQLELLSRWLEREGLSAGRALRRSAWRSSRPRAGRLATRRGCRFAAWRCRWSIWRGLGIAPGRGAVGRGG